MISRKPHLRQAKDLLRRFPVAGILGPRQVGKSTLARQLLAARPGQRHWFDLEDPADRDRLRQPLEALGQLRGLVVLDEVQFVPGIFESLRVLADRRPLRARYLVLGSASPELLKQGSESLAGRIAFHELEGLSLQELPLKSAGRLWQRGGFPLSYLASSEAASLDWRRRFMDSFLSRDLPALVPGSSPETMRRFWAMVAHYHGQVLNLSELARSFGVSDHSIRRYSELLASTFMLRLLRPWHENLGKRLVRTPKIYIRDSGLLHALLGIRTSADLELHPKLGASWEGFAMEQVLGVLRPRADEAYFWATHQGAEIDLLLVRGRERLGFEFKASSSPGLTKSMRSAMNDLKLKRLHVVHRGSQSYSLDRAVQAMPLQKLLKELKPRAK